MALVNGEAGISSAVQPVAQIQQQLGVEPGADLAGEHEIVGLEVADEQCAQADPAALRIGEPADDELLRRLAFHLQPVRRAPVLVRRVAPLRDDALPPLAAGALPRLRIVERQHAVEGRLQRQLIEQRAARVERQRGDVASVEPHDVEDVIADRVGHPR